MEKSTGVPFAEANAQSGMGFFTGVVNMLPLCLSVVPWGILAGSMAVQAGLTLPQSIGMSAILFA
ncbi:MAG TPA: branched-chain amino acid ABC transporter permease, partial [Erwinia persicina]|nr:branched-chain amino acid ABC transporter permease [Erwinia persicina]